MSTVEIEQSTASASSSVAPWYERVGDRLNAILIKEVRQAFKSRQFITMFMLLLTISWLVSAFGLLNSLNAVGHQSMGRDFFYAFYVVLAFAAIIVIPFGVFRSLQSERDLNTYELLSITTLSPRQIVWGKLLSSQVQLFVFYSAITPFIAFSSLLEGFSISHAAYILVFTVLQSILLSMATLMLSTFTKNRMMQGLITIGILGGLVGMFSWSISGVWGAIHQEWVTITDPNLWWVTGIFFVFGVSYFVLFHQIAVSHLTFESDNRHSGVRCIVSLQFWLLWIVYAGFLYAREIAVDVDVLKVLVFFSAIHWAAHGVLATTTLSTLSRRVQRTVPRTFLWRWLKSPLLPGGARAFSFVLIHLAALWGIVFVFQTFSEIPLDSGLSSAELRELFLEQLFVAPSFETLLMKVTTVVCGYIVIYTGIATAVGRWGRKYSFITTSGHVRAVIFFLFAIGMVLPLLLRMVNTVSSPGYAAADITSVHATIWMLFQEHNSAYVPFVLRTITSVAGIVLLINTPAIYEDIFQLKPLKKGER